MAHLIFVTKEYLSNLYRIYIVSELFGLCIDHMKEVLHLDLLYGVQLMGFGAVQVIGKCMLDLFVVASNT